MCDKDFTPVWTVVAIKNTKRVAGVELQAEMRWNDGINFPRYADDTQLYVVVSLDTTELILFNCMLDFNFWMAENILQPNQDKTEVLAIGPEAQREKLHCKREAVRPKPLEKGKYLFDSNINADT